MYNVLIDKFPVTYKGYLIRTDFRVGIQLYICNKDTSLSDQEKYIIMLRLLYGNGIPKNIKTALDGLFWFLNVGQEMKQDTTKSKKASKEKEILDFEIDSTRIYSGFKSKFGIDLNTEKIHWFEFRYLLLELKDCHLSDIIEIRQKKIDNNMDAEQRIMYYKLKKQYALNDDNEENLDTQNELMKYLKRSRGVNND